MNVEKEVNRSVIRAPSALDNHGRQDLMRAGQDVLRSPAPDLVLDLSATEFIDSAAIGALVSLTKDFKSKGARFSLRGLRPDIMNLFVDTGLDRIFDVETPAGLRVASIDLFEASSDIRLDIATEVKGDVCIFHLKGVMNHPAGSRYFRQQFLLSLTGSRRILLDLEELTFFDSLSVSAVLTLNELVKKTGGSLRMCRANFIVDELFTTLSIDHVIPCFGSIEAALSDWNSA